MKIVDFFPVNNEFLLKHPNAVLVHDENLLGNHMKRMHNVSLKKVKNQLYGFITYKYQERKYKGKYGRWYYIMIPTGYYIDEVFPVELERLKDEIKDNPSKTYLILPLGLGKPLFESFIFYNAVRPKFIKELKDFSNVYLLWNNLLLNRAYTYTPLCLSQLAPGLGQQDVREKQALLHCAKWEELLSPTVDLERIDNEQIKVEIPNGVYTKENSNEK